jgi:inosine-uridine nucleoside N-ribohydrolase
LELVINHAIDFLIRTIADNYRETDLLCLGALRNVAVPAIGQAGIVQKLKDVIFDCAVV